MQDHIPPPIAPPPVLLLLDLSALLAGKTREWQEFSRVGRCFVPQAVLEEMKELATQAAEAEQEQTAREFARFYPTSGWKPIAISAPHPSLQPVKGAALSKKARLHQAVAEAAYGLAQHQQKALVVVISNDQPLLQRLRTLDVANLCGIAVAALVLWSRTQRRPAVVNHQLRQVGLAAGSQTATSQTGVSRTHSVTTSPTPIASRTPPTTSVSRSTARHSAATLPSAAPATRSSRTYSRPDRDFSLGSFLSQTISIIVAVAVMTMVIGIAWRTFHPPSFNRFWQKNVVPMLSQPSPPAKAKPAK